jgi:hypothetical protein
MHEHWNHRGDVFSMMELSPSKKRPAVTQEDGSLPNQDDNDIGSSIVDSNVLKLSSSGKKTEIHQY